MFSKCYKYNLYKFFLTATSTSRSLGKARGWPDMVLFTLVSISCKLEKDFKFGWQYVLCELQDNCTHYSNQNVGVREWSGGLGNHISLYEIKLAMIMSVINANAFIFTIIACSNVSAYLHDIQSLIYICPLMDMAYINIYTMPYWLLLFLWKCTYCC